MKERHGETAPKPHQRKGECTMEGKNRLSVRSISLLAVTAAVASATFTLAAEQTVGKTSYAPVAATESFSTVKQDMEKQKKAVMKRQMDLLGMRYDLADKPSRGDHVAGQGRAGRCAGQTPPRDDLAAACGHDPRGNQREETFPKGFMPLPHPNHRGGMLFPKFHIDEVKKRLDGPDPFRSRLRYP